MDESGLIEKAIAGDRWAFGELAARHRAAVFAACLRLTGNAADAEDLAHESLVQAWLELEQLRDPQRFGGWLRMVTLNVFRGWYRRRRPEEELSEDLPAPEPEPSDEGLLAAISRGLLRVSAPHRIALVLHYLEGLSYEQLAAFLDIPIGTVMSRLYRGRRALEEAVRRGEEDLNVTDQPGIEEGVVAEIAVLRELFRAQPEAAERLSVILDRSPGRLGQLLDVEVSAEALSAMGALLPRLGATATGPVLDAAFSGSPIAVANARAVLTSAAARLKAPAWPGGADLSAGLSCYALVDLLLAHPAPARAKAALLLNLLPAARGEGAGDLLAEALRTLGQAASEELIGWYTRLEAPQALFASRPLLGALLRSGEPFLRALAADLDGAGFARMLVGLAGAEALGRALDPEELAGASPEQWTLEARHRGWVRSGDFAADSLAGLRRRVGGLLAEENPSVREAAIRAAAALGLRERQEELRAAMADARASIRVAAIRALSALSDSQAVEPLMASAREGEAMERLAALDALGRLKDFRAKDLLLELVDDPSEPVQVAAVGALAELGGDEIGAVLRRLASAGPAARRRAAATAAFREVRKRPEPSELERKVWEKLRGPDARPVAEMSLEAALRYALTEPRAYPERELTQRLARVCVDFSSTRRMLVELGVMTRDAAEYRFTPLGEAAWRVERRLPA